MESRIFVALMYLLLNAVKVFPTIPVIRIFQVDLKANKKYIKYSYYKMFIQVI
jgi:hypothetical protein